MPSRHTQTGSTPLWLLIWLVGMAAIAYWCVVRHLPAIQGQLQSNAQAAVTEVGVPDVTVNVHGRTATLTGAVTTVAQKDSLLGALSNTNGIRSVDNQLNVVEMAIASSEQNEPIAQSKVQTNEQTSESDEETSDASNDDAPAASDDNADASVENTEATVNEAPVEEAPAQADIAPAQDNQDSDALNQQSETAQSVSEPSASEQPDTEQLVDDVDAKARALIEQAKNNELQSKQATNAASKPATFNMRVSDDTLTLTGDMSREDNLTQFVRSAMSTFDASYVVNSVQVSNDVAPAPWLNALTQFVADMEPVSNAGIDLFESQISLSGVAPNEQSHDSIINNALSKLPDLSLVERISIADPDNASVENNASSGTTGAEPQAIATTNSDEQTDTSAIAQPSALRTELNALESTTILFESGSDVLTTDSLRTIESLAALFAEYPNIEIEIDGHTDSSGLAANNLNLSQQRANAVRDYLIKLGLSANRLSAYGFGDGVPIADNSTPAGRKMNRRIEFNF